MLYAQADHAAVSGDCAAMLQAPPEPRGALVAAARLHDNGWREEDERPRFDPASRQPFSFHEIPHGPYMQIWQRGIDRALAVDPHVGLLVMLHGGRFFARSEDPAFREFFAKLRERGDEVLRELGREGTFERPPPDVQAQFEWVRFLDAVSLVVCGAPEWARRPRVGSTQYELTPEGARVRVSPFAFREPFEVRIPARRLASGTFDSQDALDAAFRDAAPRMERYQIVP